MADPNNLRMISYNCALCAGVKNKIPVIAKFCKNADIIFLQETWLLPTDLDILNNVDKDFHSFSLSSVDTGDRILIGRPYGGVSILWKRDLSPVCRDSKF